MKPKSDYHKTAIKIANKYADSYKVLEIENKSLKKELEDSLINLSINKNIITDLTNPIKFNYKEKIMIDNLKKEILNLQSIISNKTIENNDLKQLISSNNLHTSISIDKSANLTSMNYNNCNNILCKDLEKTIETLNNNVFVLENTIIKNNNLIKQLRLKIDELTNIKSMSSNLFIEEISVRNKI